MPRAKKTLEEKVEEHLYAMVCSGGGNSQTLLDDARHIVTLARKHIAQEILDAPGS
jgi:hypothetical protein